VNHKLAYVRISGFEQAHERLWSFFNAVDDRFLVQHLAGTEERDHFRQKCRHAMKMICDQQSLHPQAADDDLVQIFRTWRR
jgi:hypothetical protein